MFRILAPALLAFSLLAQLPLQERMKTWQMKHRHPDPHYLSTQGEFYGVDQNERVYEFKLMGPKAVIIMTGKAAQRPDASAQVDEIRAQLFDQSKKAP